MAGEGLHGWVPPIGAKAGKVWAGRAAEEALSRQDLEAHPVNRSYVNA